MTPDIQHFRVKKQNNSTKIWGLMQIQDPWFDLNTSVYTPPSYLAFWGECGQDLYQLTYPEVSHWKLVELVEQKQVEGYRDFGIHQISELDPNLEKQLTKIDFLAKLKL